MTAREADPPVTAAGDEPAGRRSEPATTAPAEAVPDLLTVELPADAWVLVCSDLHLGQRPTRASRRMQHDLVLRLASCTGPGAVVLNGDVVDLWDAPDGDVTAALDAHPELSAALRAFAAQPGRRVVVVVGNHDAAIAFDGVSAAAFARLWAARCALAVQLAFDTPAGRRVVACEHGHAFDPANALRDPRNPLDSPLGQHIVQEVLPQLRRSPLLADVAALTNPNAAGRLVASRLIYRQLGRRLWWLLLPLVAVLLVRTPVMIRVLSRQAQLARVERWAIFAGLGLVADVALVALLVVLVARGLYAALAPHRLWPRGRRNGTPRAAAAARCAAGPDRIDGLVTGHTHEPELAAVAGGFYANTGSGTRAVVSRRARWLLPPVFEAVLRRSWVELDVEGDLRVRLVVAESPAGEATRLERLAMRRRRPYPDTPRVVATLPGQAGWPLQQDALARRARAERIRRLAAFAVAAIAVIGLVSALTRPVRGRLTALLDVLPVAAPQAAAAETVFVSTGLLAVAWGLRRGRSLAWAVAVVLLTVSAGLHLLKDLDGEEALLALLVAGWLAAHRAAFPTHPDGRQLRRAAAVLVVGVLLTAAASVLLVLVTGVHGGSGHSAEEVAEVLAGREGIPLPAISALLAPVFYAAGACLVVALALVLLRPRLHRSGSGADVPAHQTDLGRARRVVATYGGDTLSYFALRADKSWFFTGDCVVAYDVRDGVCLVSPDPIGPAQQHADAWAQFTAFADRNGWPVTVVGAAESWLPIYQAAGARPIYLGDEAIVNCTAFTLEGRAVKSLRGAVNRVRRAGYTVHFHDPATLPAELAGKLLALAGQSRKGEAERGFSMTLSRLFDPADTGLLLSVAYGPDGEPGGFCQWIPAPDITGWSLDVMRRRLTPETPNGLTDFLIVETIAHLRARGEWGLALNFAVLRGVLAGERGDGRLTELQRRLLRRFADGTQMETLWRFNDKFQPLWRPRYVVLSGAGTAALEGIAVAGAEGVTEIPVLGRLLSRP